MRRWHSIGSATRCRIECDNLGLGRVPTLVCLRTATKSIFSLSVGASFCTICMGMVQRAGTSLPFSSHTAWPPTSTPLFSQFRNPIRSHVDGSTTADAVHFVHALCLTKPPQHSIAKHLCNKPSTHPSSASMSDCNVVSLSVRAKFSFTCNSSQGMCPCEQCACMGGFECPMPAPLVCAHPHSTAVLMWPSATVCP